MNKKQEFQNLQAQFPDAKLCKFLTIKSEYNDVITTKMRWVYSVLLWRRRGHLTSKNKLSQLTGVHRTKTLPKLLAELKTLNLVRQIGTKFQSVVPKDEVLSYVKSFTTSNGQQRLSYNWAVYIPGKDIIDGFVAVKDSYRKYPASLLAKWIGCNRRTISAARKRNVEFAKNSKTGIERAPEIKETIEMMAVVEPTPESKPEISVTVENKNMPASAHSIAKLATQLQVKHGEAGELLAKLWHTVLPNSTSKERGMVASALSEKFGVGEELADYLFAKLPEWQQMDLSADYIIQLIRGNK